MIHDSENGIFSVAYGKTRDKIHCYLLEGEGVVGRRDAVWGSACLVGDDLVLLAYCASLSTGGIASPFVWFHPYLGVQP
jgi:hypothetical protein